MVPTFNAWSPVVVSEVALVAVRPVRVLALSVLAIEIDSTPGIVIVPAVTLARVTATESDVPAVAAVLKASDVF
jgi:hypothetical protein